MICTIFKMVQTLLRVSTISCMLAVEPLHKIQRTYVMGFHQRPIERIYRSQVVIDGPSRVSTIVNEDDILMPPFFADRMIPYVFVQVTYITRISETMRHIRLNTVTRD